MTGFGGRINKFVSSSVEDVARKGESRELEKTKTKQFTGANKIVLLRLSLVKPFDCKT